MRPDVVHTHQMTALLYAGRAARQERIPVVHTEHNNVAAHRSKSWGRRLRTELLWRCRGAVRRPVLRGFTGRDRGRQGVRFDPGGGS